MRESARVRDRGESWQARGIDEKDSTIAKRRPSNSKRRVGASMESRERVRGGERDKSERRNWGPSSLLEP